MSLPPRLAPILFAAVSALVLGWVFWPAPTPTPALIAGLADDGLRGAPCPARSLQEQAERRKHGAQKPAGLGARLREKFPLGSDEAALRNALTMDNFSFFSPCPNDLDVSGARWRSPDWERPDAYVYWRSDANNRLEFLDGHVNRTN